MNALLKLSLGLVGLTIGGVAVFLLRESTLSTHKPVSPDSRVEVVVDIETRSPERDQSPSEMVDALLLLCRLEVSSDLVGAVTQVDDRRFRAVLQPTLDQTNRRQFRGCVEDWTIDGLRAEVVSVEELAHP